MVAGAVGPTAAGGGWVPVPEIGGGTGRVVVGGTVVVVVAGTVVVVVVFGGGAVVVVVAGGVVVVVVEQLHEPWVAAGAREALQAAPPSVTLKAIITSTEPMATTVRFTVDPSCFLVDHGAALVRHTGVGQRRFRGCCLSDRPAPCPREASPSGRGSSASIRSGFAALGPEPSTWWMS
jgi:hypothetical protein